VEIKDPIYLEMMRYYDSKSKNFDDYWNRELYQDTEENRLLFSERDMIDNLAKKFGSGSCIDLGCGTSHWLSFYYTNCSHVTLVDQSESMIEISKSKVNNLPSNSTSFLYENCDVFELEFKENNFQSVLFGNLLGHLTDRMMANLFHRINLMLVKGGSIFISDSLVHSGISLTDRKENIQLRKVDGIEYRIFKRYFEKETIENILNTYHFKITSQYFGKYFFGLIATQNEK